MTEPETTGLKWRKAQASTANGACVEVAVVPGGVAVRDSKNPGGPVLVCRTAQWQVFLCDLRA